VEFDDFPEESMMISMRGIPTPADILERAYHRKNDGVNHLKRIFEI
jgi:hypothetical protein